MSAYVVSKSQIDVLVAAGARAITSDDFIPTREQLSKLGQTLLDECVRSFAYRYSKPGRVHYYGPDAADEMEDDDLGDLPGTFVSVQLAPELEPIQFAEWLTPYEYNGDASELYREDVEDEIRCYDYQSCEHPEWEDSWARSYVVGLRAQLGTFPLKPKPVEPKPDPDEFRRLYGDLSRDETIKRIRAALKRRSGKTWSVTGGRGTAWGWIHIQSPPKRRTGKHVQKPGAEFGEYEHVDTGERQEFGLMTPQDCRELGELLGLDRPVHCQGHGIAASSDHRREYIDRAEGREPTKYGTQYWD